MTHYRVKYLQGYSVGVGAVVVHGDRALLIHRALGRGTGDWAIPSGFVDRGETINVAVQREVFEETGIQAEIEGLIAVRSRVTDEENSAYFIFLLRARDDEAIADGREVDEARFFSVEEIQELPRRRVRVAMAPRTLPRLQKLSRLLVTMALKGEASVLQFHTHPDIPATEYVIYA